MRKILLASRPFLIEIVHDFMMVACIIAPILMGVVFKFVIPLLEGILCNYFMKTQIIAPYYIIFDLLLAILTPILFTFSGVLTMLEEFDLGIAKYYFVTPVGKKGYLQSRLFFPAIISMLYGMILLIFFNISNISFIMILVFSFSGALMAVICAMLVVAYAKNKIEGMALIKLCGLLIVGIPVAYFVNSPVRYVFSVLPSFWLAQLSITGNYLYTLPTVSTSIIIILLLYAKFNRRLVT